MYLTNLLINTGDNPDRPRPGRLWLRNLYRVHQRLCMGFPSAARKQADSEFLNPYNPNDFIGAYPPDHIHNHVHGQRTVEQAFLFRIDPLLAGRAMIIVQSAAKPNWDYAFQNAGYLLAGPPQVKEFAPDFQDSRLYKFRLLANATRKIDTKTREDGTKSNGNRVPVSAEKIKEWLQVRGARCGFHIRENDLDVRTGYLNASTGNDDASKRFFYARYDGLLQATDATALRQAVTGGIGPAKGFGFGLLSVASVKE